MGKGSKPRPVDIKKYCANWGEIAWSKKDNPALCSDTTIRGGPDNSRETPEVEIQYSSTLCEHANEVPNLCKCPSNCYCKTHSCQITDEQMGDICEQALRDSCEESRIQLEKLVKTPKGKATRYVYR